MITRTQKINEEMTFKKLLTGDKHVGLRNLDTLCKITRNFVNQVGKREKTIVFPHPETNPHLQLHTIVTNSAFVYCLLRMGK
jgi:hypothetical protein